MTLLQRPISVVPTITVNRLQTIIGLQSVLIQMTKNRLVISIIDPRAMVGIPNFQQKVCLTKVDAQPNEVSSPTAQFIRTQHGHVSSPHTPRYKLRPISVPTTPFIVPIAAARPLPRVDSVAQARQSNAHIPDFGPSWTQSAVAPAKYKDAAMMQPLYPTPQEYERVVEERDVLQERLAASELELQRLKDGMAGLGTKLIRGEF